MFILTLEADGTTSEPVATRWTYRSWTSSLRAAENLNKTIHDFFRIECFFGCYQTLTGNLAIIIFGKALDRVEKRTPDRKKLRQAKILIAAANL